MRERGEEGGGGKEEERKRRRNTCTCTVGERRIYSLTVLKLVKLHVSTIFSKAVNFFAIC